MRAIKELFLNLGYAIRYRIFLLRRSWRSLVSRKKFLRRFRRPFKPKYDPDWTPEERAVWDALFAARIRGEFGDNRWDR